MTKIRDKDDVLTLATNIAQTANEIITTLNVSGENGLKEIKKALSEIDVKLSTAAFEFGSSQEWMR